MQELLIGCISSDIMYKKMSERIVVSCSKDSTTAFKTQKVCIDKIKEVIKSNPKKVKASEKFYALKLLNKIIMKKNTELNKYIE